MQFKKLAAIAGSALMAGLSLAAPVLATSVTKLSDISKLVSVTGTTVSFPMFVIGATAATSDVAGAVDVAVNLASNAVVTSQVTTTGAGVSITGGVSMATPSNPITMWDNFSSSRQVLTASDLPDILQSQTYSDAASVTAPYAQYLTFTNAAANGRVEFNQPSGGTAPALGLRFPGGSGGQIYNYLLSFTKQVSEAVSSNTITNMGNTQLNMLGQIWTVTGATVTSTGDMDIMMLAGQNSQTVTTAAPATYTVGSNTFTVTLVAVGLIGTTPAVTLTVSGGTLASPQTLQILSGGTKSLPDGTMIGVSSIFSTSKTGSIDSATVFVGANKLELEDNIINDTTYYAGIKLNGNSLTDATVRMIGTVPSATAVTLNSIEVQWTPSLEKFMTAGTSLPDYVTNGAFKIFFGGISPALDDTTNREIITVTPSGTTAGIAFKDAGGNSLNQNFAHNINTSLVNGALALADAGNYTIHVVEGETVNQNEYMVLGQNSYAASAQNPFGHIIRVLSLGTSTTTTSQFQDIASGTTLPVTGGNTTMYLDGQPYQVCVLSTTTVKFTWGTGAYANTTGCSVGSAYDVFPAIQTSKGAMVSLTNPVTLTTSGTANFTLNLPTGSLNINATNGPSGLQTAGTGLGKYNITALGTSIVIKASDNSLAPFSTPGVMVVEGLDASTLRNIIAFRLDSDTTVNRIDIVAPTSFFTSTTTTTSGISGTTQNKYVDVFGSYVTYDSTAAGTFSLSYPSSQAVAIVGVGANPAAGTGTSGGTITTQTVLPITADVVKLDSEVTSADQSANDLILVGGPCINTLVATLATANKFPYTCANWPGRNFGRVQLISDAFATGKTALVIAGTTAADTDLASRVVQTGFSGATDTQKAGSSIEVTGSVSSPAYS